MKDYTKFFTPDSVADKMVEYANLAPNMRVLEPHAGDGQIVRAIRRAKQWDVGITVFEINEEYTSALIKCANFTNICNFLKINVHKETFDRVIANPPFGNGIDLASHLDKMLHCLKSGGILITIIPQECASYFNDLGLSVLESIDNWASNSDGTTTPICIVKYLKP